MIIIELIYNLSILIAISVLAGFIDKRWKSKTLLGSSLQGILFGTAIIIGMMNPFVYAPGIIFDGRSVMLSLCGLFFGPVSAIIAATMALIFRVHIGGTGIIMGTSVIVSSTLIGILANYLRRKRALKISSLFLYAIGLVVHIIMLALMIGLPSNIRFDTLKTISLTVIGLYPLATILIGKILSDQEEKNELIKELSHERNLLRTVIDSLPFSLYVKDKKLKKLLANKAELLMVNKTEEKVIGKDDFELFPREQAEIFLEDDLQVIEKEIPIIEKIEFLHLPDESKRWLSTTKLPWKDESGNIIGLVGFGFDVSDKVEDDKKIRILSEAVKQSPNSIIISNIEGIIEYVNPRFEETTGYIQRDVIGKNVRILKKGITPDSTFDDIWKTILSGNKWKNDFLSKRKSGETYWESVIISPIFNDQNKITNFILITEDITERKNLISELVEAKEKAVESDKLKTAFLANMSHEIRTPMNGILGFAELLKDPDLRIDDQHKYLSVIEQSGNRLLNLINDIIDISKIEAGQIDLSYVPVNINQVIDYEYNFFIAEANNKGLKLQNTKGLPDEKATILTDKLRLNQILTNLIKNSIKFTTKGDIEFGYSLKDGFMEFYVRDDGIGISKEMRDKIFERFHQGDLVLTRRYEGSGLGLSISKAFIEMLGGQIWVLSDEGKGSTFFFTIPYKTV